MAISQQRPLHGQGGFPGEADAFVMKVYEVLGSPSGRMWFQLPLFHR